LGLAPLVSVVECSVCLSILSPDQGAEKYVGWFRWLDWLAENFDKLPCEDVGYGNIRLLGFMHLRLELSMLMYDKSAYSCGVGSKLVCRLQVV